MMRRLGDAMSSMARLRRQDRLPFCASSAAMSSQASCRCSSRTTSPMMRCLCTVACSNLEHTTHFEGMQAHDSKAQAPRWAAVCASSAPMSLQPQHVRMMQCLCSIAPAELSVRQVMSRHGRLLIGRRHKNCSQQADIFTLRAAYCL